MSDQTKQFDVEFTGTLLGDWRDGYFSAVARYVVERGKFVDLRHYHGPYETWQDRADDDYDDFSTTYGWADYDHLRHVDWKKDHKPCRVVSVDQSSVREQELSEFNGSDADNLVKVGVEVKATCACGEYTNKWLRWDGSASEILRVILGGAR